jgi:hypothetical protein
MVIHHNHSQRASWPAHGNSLRTAGSGAGISEAAANRCRKTSKVDSTGMGFGMTPGSKPCGKYTVLIVLPRVGHGH